MLVGYNFIHIYIFFLKLLPLYSETQCNFTGSCSKRSSCNKGLQIWLNGCRTLHTSMHTVLFSLSAFVLPRIINFHNTMLVMSMPLIPCSNTCSFNEKQVWGHCCQHQLMTFWALSFNFWLSGLVRNGLYMANFGKWSPPPQVLL